MANNKLIKVSQKAETPSPLNSLGDIEQTLDKLWNMFQTQVNRNAELMLVIQQQQQELQQIKKSPVAVEIISAPKQLTEVTTSNMPELGYEKLKRIEEVLCNKVNIFVRSDALHSLVNVFHYLYQFGGEAYPEQLVSLSGVSSATFYRYLTRMRECHIVRMVRGKAVITELGRKIYNEELNGQMEVHKAIDKETFGKEFEPEVYQKFVDKMKGAGVTID